MVGVEHTLKQNNASIFETKSNDYFEFRFWERRFRKNSLITLNANRLNKSYISHLSRLRWHSNIGRNIILGINFSI
jgi:hypothetical protein